MMAAMVERGLRAAERELGESVDYLRAIYRASRSAFFKFWLFLPLAGHAGPLPPAVLAVARLTAALQADCGACAQMVINHALRQGVEPGILRALASGCPERLPGDLCEVHLFARSVATRDPRADEMRTMLTARYGEAGMVALALAIGSQQVFPTVKYALGYSRSCAGLRVDG